MFKDAQSFYQWLGKHYAREDEIWIKIHKVDSGFKSITPKEAIDVVRCWGWIVHSGVGVALVPEAAQNLQFSGVALRPLADPQQRPAELYFVWRDDNDNPLLPVIATIARDLAGGA